MKKFIIEREIPGAGKLSSSELRTLAIKSCEVINGLDEPYYWVESFVTDNKLYCIHIAPDRATIEKHALQGGFPADRIMEIKTVIDPTTSTKEITAVIPSVFDKLR